MNQKIAQITVPSLLAATLILLPASSRAEDTGTNAPASSETAPAKPGKHGTLPFHGTLTAVDAKAMTLTVGKLTLQVTTNTVIFQGGKSATLADGAVGERVGGTYKRTEDGKLYAVSVHYMPKPEIKAQGATNSAGAQ